MHVGVRVASQAVHSNGTVDAELAAAIAKL